MRRIAMHADENDPQRMNLVLNNASNVFKHYSELNESVQIETASAFRPAQRAGQYEKEVR